MAAFVPRGHWQASKALSSVHFGSLQTTCEFIKTQAIVSITFCLHTWTSWRVVLCHQTQVPSLVMSLALRIYAHLQVGCLT